MQYCTAYIRRGDALESLRIRTSVAGSLLVSFLVALVVCGLQCPHSASNLALCVSSNRNNSSPTPVPLQDISAIRKTSHTTVRVQPLEYARTCPFYSSRHRVGLVVPALHITRVLRDDVKRIKDAPQEVSDLGIDVDSLADCLELLQSVQQPEWDKLGADAANKTQKAVRSCEDACAGFHTQLKEWTKHSGNDGKLERFPGPCTSPRYARRYTLSTTAFNTRYLNNHGSYRRSDRVSEILRSSAYS